MKKILFPTDLSENSRKALFYAQYLSINTGSELVLLHSYLEQAEIGTAKEELRKLIEELERSEVRGAKTIRYDYVLEEGLPVTQVVELMEKTKYKMLVMATAGADREHFQGIYLKSNTAAVLEKLEKPVLFFPIDAKVDKVSKVLIAVDVMKYSRETLEQFCDFIKLFNAKLNFVYVSNTQNLQVTEAIKRFDVFIEKHQLGNSLEVVLNKPFEESINEMIQSKRSDLLVMTKYKRQFWEKWFNKSATQAMAYRSIIPVMVLSAD